MRSIDVIRIVIQGIPAALLAAVVGSGLSGCSSSATSAHKPPPPIVTVVVARKTNVPIVVNRQGTTRALNDVTIRARVQGFLKEQHFHEGMNVKEGQNLLVIDEEPFKVKLDQTRAKLDEATAALKKAVQSKAPEIAQAQLALDEAQRSLDQVEEKRERTLLTRNAATIDDVDRRQAQVRKSVAQVEADKASLEQARADYDVNILSAKASVAAAQADVRDAEISLGYCRMDAPINGRIGELRTKLGNLVGPNQNTELVTIQQLDPMGIDLYPPARYLPLINRLIKNGLYMKVYVEGQREHPQEARAYFIDNAVESTTGTVLMKASVPNPDESLLPGQYVKVKINGGEYRAVILVPEKAVIEGQEGASVYVVDTKDGKKVKQVSVVPIDTYRGMRILRSGVQPGQLVIVEGLQLVHPDQEVEFEEAPLEKFFQEESQSPEDQRFESDVAVPPSSSEGAKPEETKSEPSTRPEPGTAASARPPQKDAARGALKDR